MSKASARETAFIRHLLQTRLPAVRRGSLFHLEMNGKTSSLPVETCRRMASGGLLTITGAKAICRPEARMWLRRQLNGTDTPLADQHRILQQQDTGASVNHAESPLARLVQMQKGKEAFLRPHHLEAAVRFQRLFARARLRQRTTMSYETVRVDQSRRPADGTQDPQGLTVDARKELDRLARIMPSDCLTALVDVCGFEKRLQLVEAERGWPRRSAKMILRIALDHLASRYGLTDMAEGEERNRLSVWQEDDARPSEIG